MKKIPVLDLDVRYFEYLWPYGFHLSLAFLTMVGVAALDVVSPWPLKYVVDNVIGGRPFGDPFSRAVAAVVGTDPRVLTVIFGGAIIVFAALSGLFSFTFEYL